MALTGNVGGVVLQQDNAYKVHPDINFISEADKNLLNKILQLGYLYSNIYEFVQKSQKNYMNYVVEETLKKVVNDKGMEIERDEEEKKET